MNETEGMGSTPRTGMSKGMKWLVGCLVAFLVFAVVCGVVGYFAAKRVYQIAKDELERMESEFTSMGFEKRVLEQIIDVEEPVTEPTLFIGQSVTIKAGSETDIAIMAQVGAISGTVEGTVYFIGQTIDVKEDCIIKGDLKVRAQNVNIQGTVEGEVVGDWQFGGQTEGAEEAGEAPPVEETPEEAEPAAPESATESPGSGVVEPPAGAEAPAE